MITAPRTRTSTSAKREPRRRAKWPGAAVRASRRGGYFTAGLVMAKSVSDRPRSNPVTAPTATIPLPSNGHLAGTYLPGTTHPDFAVVWVHGFGSHRGGEKAETVRAECARRGWTFAAFDFRGHGES